MKVIEIIFLLVSAASQLLMSLCLLAIFGKIDTASRSDDMTEGVKQAGIAVQDQDDGDYYVSKRGSTIKVWEISRGDSEAKSGK